MSAGLSYPWLAAARRAGMDAEGRLNSAAIPIAQQSALVWRRADGTSRTLSGADLQRRAAEIGAALVALGVERGDRVGGILGRRPDAFALPLAVWRLGAVYVPLFSGFGRDAVSVRLADCEARALVVDAGNAAAAAQACERLPQLRTLSVEAAGDLVEATVEGLIGPAPREPEMCPTASTETATIMYTSGTTGPPKGCMIAHYGAVNLWPFVEHCLALGAGDVLFSTADTGWSFGLYTTGFAPMTLGVTRVLYEGAFDASQWWRAAAETGADHMASAPTGFRQLATAGAETLGEPPRRLTGATSCGEPLTAEVVEWFGEHLGFAIHDSYGLTELGILVAQLRRNGDGDHPSDGSMGTALPGFQIGLLDEEGREVPEGEPGRVAVRDHGWLLSRGYWGRTEDWEARQRDGWWVTEDLARREGERYWYVGRADDVIVTAGYNVGPAAIEEIVLEHPAVVDAACVGEPDERKGQVIGAHVVLRDGGGVAPEGLLEELREAVGERLGWHCAPRAIHVAAALPRTESGKVRRRDLREAAG